MTGIELYSTTAANNNSATPNGWPEGQAPSTVNDCARQMMAAIRSWYESSEWINWGDTTVYVSSTSFKVAGSDVTSRYTVGRRVKAVGSSTGTIYGKIVTSAFSTDTTITVVWDTGSLSNETLTISIGAIKGGATGAVASSTRSIDFDNGFVHGADVASASTIVLDNTNGELVDVTGTTTITAITLAEGRCRTVRFTGALTLTNGASLVLPGGADIVTVAGDYAIFRGYASSVVRCIGYFPATKLIAFGGKIAFPATQSASSDANTLDDYEEGTWTPVLTFGTAGNLSVVYSEQSAVYVKIGRWVWVNADIQTSTWTHTTASGSLNVSGLPFAPDIAEFQGTAVCAGWTKANYGQISAQITSGQSVVAFLATGSGQALATLTTTECPSGTQQTVRFNLEYRTAS